jgi:hypothetical protein
VLLDFQSQPNFMAERSSVEQVVERVITQVLERHVPQLREEIARSVLAEIAPLLEHPAGGAVSGGGNTASLVKALGVIHRGTTQREILRALLDSTLPYSGRSALFVIKAGAASGWEARGFANNEELKDFALDISSGLAFRAMESRVPFTGAVEEMDENFRAKFGTPHDLKVLVLPLLLKDKVAAILYVDAGVEPGSHLDPNALELLVNSTSAWLEVASLRKQAHKDGAADPASPERMAAPPVQTVSSFSDPFAGHSPIHGSSSGAAAAFAPEEAATSVAAAVVEPKDVAEPVEESSPQQEVATAAASLSPEQAEVHRKAQRFARLLVDEIKLYNQAKVSDGRKNRDLYDRLKEDIEKSRATYQKRYGNTAASSTDYFSIELVRSLAADDSSLMGANFRR